MFVKIPSIRFHTNQPFGAVATLRTDGQELDSNVSFRSLFFVLARRNKKKIKKMNTAKSVKTEKAGR
jgi:hypothetical protein